MPDRLDAYYKWLGIPPEEQPPHHYRLLGVAPFETDTDVINNAADQRMGLLKTFATGVHGALSEEILNQVARARVCLLNPAKKIAYDDALRKQSLHDYLVDRLAKTAYDDALQKKSVEIQRELPESVTSSIQPTDNIGLHFDPHLAASIPDVGIVPLRRHEKSSPTTNILGIVLGGVVGLSAAYFILCLFGIQYDFLHLMSVEKPAALRAVPNRKPRIVSRDVPADETRKSIASRLPSTTLQAPPSAIEPNAPEPPKINLEPPANTVVKQVLKKAAPVDIEVFDKPSGIVTLTLEKPVIRVIAESEKAGEVVCDIGFSQNLLHRGDGREGYALVSQGLGHRGKATVELGANIRGAGAAIEITVLRQNSLITCELRPLFSLPSGDIQPLTITRGTTLYNKLNKSFDAAKSARDLLPTIRSNLSRLQTDLRDAQQPKGPAKIIDLARVTSLKQQVAAQDKKITAAEQLSAQEPAISRDLQSLNEIAEYAKGIASVSTVSVRFHIGGSTVPAKVK